MFRTQKTLEDILKPLNKMLADLDKHAENELATKQGKQELIAKLQSENEVHDLNVEQAQNVAANLRNLTGSAA